MRLNENEVDVLDRLSVLVYDIIGLTERTLRGAVLFSLKGKEEPRW